MDTALILSAWDFDLGEIAVPVQLWQGVQDRNVSRAMFDHLARSIPTAQLRQIPGERHISLIVSQAEEILKALI